MRKSDFQAIVHQRCHSEGWNDCADGWEPDSSTLKTPTTYYTGVNRESYIEGFLAAQEYLILERAKNKSENT